MFQKRTLIIVFVVVALGLAFGTLFFRSNHTKQTKKAEASDATNTITTQADWDAGTKTNINTASVVGSIKIDQTNTGLVFVADAGDNSYNGTYTESGTSGGKPSYTNGTRWLLFGAMGPGWWLCQNSSPAPDVSDIKYFSSGVDLPGNPWTQTIGGGTVPPPIVSISATATHTTAPTQIDGGVNFWNWDSFTDSKTTPANTSVTYRYRTSPDSTTWTSWVGDVGSVTSRTGDDSDNPTKYRYLQVESTLSNTDGTSTPTIDQYDIGYHTDVKPNKPTAATAVVQ